MGTQINPQLSWADIERMRERWKGKLVLKGILCVEDAKRSVEAGADGIVLSNHGGRQLDSCATGIELVGLHGRSPGKAEGIAARNGILAFASYADMLDAVDAVWVCTPPHVHAAVARQCVDAGAAVGVVLGLGRAGLEAVRILVRHVGGQRHLAALCN